MEDLAPTVRTGAYAELYTTTQSALRTANEIRSLQLALGPDPKMLPMTPDAVTLIFNLTVEQYHLKTKLNKIGSLFSHGSPQVDHDRAVALLRLRIVAQSLEKIQRLAEVAGMQVERWQAWTLLMMTCLAERNIQDQRALVKELEARIERRVAESNMLMIFTAWAVLFIWFTIVYIFQAECPGFLVGVVDGCHRG